MEKASPKTDGNILKVKKSEKYKAIDELFERSQPNSVYYTLLVLSAVIIAAGLLLGNIPIVIGGMLVTPMLTPILIIALSLSIGEIDPIKKESTLVAKSLLTIFLVAFVLSLVLPAVSDAPYYIYNSSLTTAVLYFVVALSSGVAATFAWVRKEVAAVLPGVAISVSLVPPLSLVGIGLSSFNFGLAQAYILIFLLNLIGVIVGSLVVFSLLKFHKTESQVKAKSANTE